ncbi:MAG: DoxX protein [Bacteroidota bacterium]
MKFITQIPAYLLGLLFVWGGAAYLFHLMPDQPLTGDSATFMKLFAETGYMTIIKICELLFGILLFIPKTRALGFILLAPIAVNILIFELHIAHAPGIGIAIVILNAIGLYLNREKYIGIIG